MNYYERHIGDYLKDAVHLSLLEHGIYCRLLDVYYTRESPIPDSQVPRLIGARSPDEISSLINVLGEFFTKDADGNWRQDRCEKEILRYREKSAKASASATKRWSNRRPNALQMDEERYEDAMRTHNEGNADGMLPKPQTPITIKPPLPPEAGGGLSDAFEEFWAAWPETPRKVAQEQCARKWMALDCDSQADLILTTLRSLKTSEEWRKNSGQFVPAPLNWIKSTAWMAPKPMHCITVAENPDVAATAARLAAEAERDLTVDPERIAAARRLSAARKLQLAYPSAADPVEAPHS